MERFTGGVAVGDVDGDDAPDVYVPRLDGPGRLFRNAGDGTFADVTDAAGLAELGEASSGAAFADVDNDGDEDLVVTTIAGRRHYLYVNDGAGAFTEEGDERGVALESGKVHFGYSIATGDYDRDGFVDLYVTEYRGLLSATVRSPAAMSALLRNRGAERPGYFEDATDAAGLGVDARTDRMFAFGATLRDLDGDGWPDLSVTADFGTSRLFWNAGDGTFVDGTETAAVGTEENGMGSTTADYDGDGRPDRFVSSVFDARAAAAVADGNWGRTGNRLYRNLGERRFEDVTDAAGVRDGQWGWGAAFFDATNAGRLDLVQVSGLDLRIGELSEPFSAGPAFFWRQQAPGRFEDISREVGLGAATNGRGLAVLDYDRDGRLDLLVARPGASPQLLRNVTEGAGRWLDVVVEGTASNRDGLHAVVTVDPGGDGERRSVEVQSVTDYLGQSERRAHFGFGAGTQRLREVVVEFPATGREVRVRDVELDRRLTVTEPR
jgi:hypothetical protein